MSLPRPLRVGRRSLPHVALLLAVGGLLGGCGFSGYRFADTFDDQVRSIAVPIFKNRSFYRDTEFGLTEALIKEIEARTPWKVAGAEAADTLLTGTIIHVDQRALSRRIGTGLTQEAQVVVVARIEWKDVRTGKILRQMDQVRGTGEYVPTSPVGEPFEIARQTAIAELSRDIVSQLRDGW